MRKIVVINTKTGEVQSVETYVKGSSDVWVAGWIETENSEATPIAGQMGKTLHNIFKRLESLEQSRHLHRQRLDNAEGNIRNINHRLEMQENSTYNYSKLFETNNETRIRIENRLNAVEELLAEQNQQVESLREATKNIPPPNRMEDERVLALLNIMVNLEKRLDTISPAEGSSALEDTKRYLLQEQDKLIEEINKIKNTLAVMDQKHLLKTVNNAGYEKPPTAKRGRGRPRKTQAP